MIFDDKLSQQMTSIYLKEIPEEITSFVLKTQGNIKSKKKIGKFSQSKTVIYIIREYKKIVDNER